MSVYQLKTFSDLVRSIRTELGVQSTDTTAINRIKEMVNVIYAEIVSKKRWWWLNGSVDLTLPAYITAGTANVLQNSNVVTLSVAPASSKKGYYFALDGYSEIYKIESHSPSSTTIRLANTFTGSTNSTATYRIWTDKLALPIDCKETIEVSHDFYRQPMDNVGRQEFNRIRRQSPRNEAKPISYFTGDFADPTALASISSLPAISTRSSNLMVKTIIFANSIPLTIANSVNAGEPVQWNIANSGHPSYNGNILIGSVSTTSVLNDTITYTGVMEYTESAIADSTMTITNVDSEQDYNRYRELFLYPALSSSPITLHVDYSREALPLNNDSDEPLVPFHDRIVLRYGALAILWSSIGRNPEEALRNKSLYQEKINQMESKWQDSTENAILRPSKNYLGAKRNLLRKRGIDLDSGPLITGGSSGGQTVTGTANTAAIFGGDGVLVASPSVSSTELGYLDGVTSNVQTQLDTITTLADGKIYIGNNSNVATEVTLSGDVTISDTGVTDITAGVIVNADINASAGIVDTKLATISTALKVSNSATTAASANTASAIVARDGSGNFSAGTISAALNGNASTVTTNANLTGDVTSVGNATTLTNAPVIAKVLTGYSSGAGTISASDSILSAIQKLNGNDATNANLTGDVTSVGNATTLTNAPVIAKVLTGYSSGAGTVSATDSILQAIQKLNGNDATNANLTGVITSVGNATSIASQTGTGTKFVVDTSPVLVTPNLGTPSSGVLTNCTGTASGLTAGNVTTNANLTGDVTSSGNATTYSGTVPLNKGGTGQTTKAAAFDSLQPMTTSGDIIYGGASGTGTRLAKGSDGQFLTLTSGLPSWGSVGNSIAVSSKTTTYSATTSDDLILCSGSAFTVTLPAATNTGKVLRIKKTDSSFTNIITVARAGSDTITDNTTGLTSTTLNTIGETLTLVSDGTATWQVVSRTYPQASTSFTPTGAWTSNTTYSGYWRRTGDNIELIAEARLSGAPTSASFTITIPSGLTIDTAKIPSDATAAYAGLGIATILAGGQARGLASVGYTNTTTLDVWAGPGAATYQAVTQAYPATFQNGDWVLVKATVPITGWN